MKEKPANISAFLKKMNGTPCSSGGEFTVSEGPCRSDRTRLPGMQIAAMGSLLLLVCVLTYWFHGVMETGVVFTHLFYIPIILSAVWWGRAGLLVAVILAAILLGSNLVRHPNIFSVNDLFRASIFIITGYVVAELSESIFKSRDVLQKREEKYRHFFSEARVGFFRTTIEEGRFLEANQMMAQILGYDSIQVLKQNCTLAKCYVNPESRAKNIEKAWGRGAIHNAEAQIYRKNGSTIWVRFSGLIRADKGYIEGVCVDITRLKRAEKSLIKANKHMVYEHKKRKQISQKLIQELEKSQRRLAMELHDQVGQELTSLKMDFELALKQGIRTGCHDPILQHIERGRDKVVRTMQSVRALCAGLKPSVLDDLGLTPALRELCNQIQDQAGILTHLFLRAIPRNLSPDIELAVYRIVQEAVTNVVRHAEAREVFISLVQRENRLILSVEDNGKGFDPPRQENPRIRQEGLGLMIMEERAIQLGGRFHMESRPGQGTHVWADFPCRNLAPPDLLLEE